MENVWKDVLDYIKEGVGQQVFNIWFKPIEFISLKNGLVELGVPNKFFKNWIIENYLLLINEAFGVFLNKKNGVKVIIKVIDELKSSKEGDVLEKPTSFNQFSGKLLNSRYTFENFVVGPSNQFAHAAALAVASLPAENYNPLFIYGGVGLGKTHLLNSIGNRIFITKKFRRIGCFSAEEFVNELINSIRYDRMSYFRNKYRKLNILLIDDIQFIGGKERTQVEFFHTFNTLYENHSQIVITSDNPPSKINGLEERLGSRFSWGLIADIQPPEIETKIAILKKKALENNVILPNDVIYFLASFSQLNIRELEGLLIRVTAFASLTESQITVDMVKDLLKNLILDKNNEIRPDDIISVVCNFFNLKISDIKSQKRHHSITQPRQIAMFLIREITGCSLSEIGNYFGGKDHSTIIYGIKKIEKKLKEDINLKNSIYSLREELGVEK